MRYNSLISARLGDDNSVRSGAPTCVWLVAAEDGKLVIGSGVGKLKTFIVVVHMRIAAGPNGLALLEVVAALGDGLIDVGLVVAG